MQFSTNANPLLIMAAELFANLSDQGQEEAVSYLTALLASEQRELASQKRVHETTE